MNMHDHAGDNAVYEDACMTIRGRADRWFKTYTLLGSPHHHHHPGRPSAH